MLISNPLKNYKNSIKKGIGHIAFLKKKLLVLHVIALWPIKACFPSSRPVSHFTVSLPSIFPACLRLCPPVSLYSSLPTTNAVRVPQFALCRASPPFYCFIQCLCLLKTACHLSAYLLMPILYMSSSFPFDLH
jgi:hypothetical protein